MAAGTRAWIGIFLRLLRLRLQWGETDRPGQSGPEGIGRVPALAEDGYGWEKLFSERMCRHFREDYGLTTRVARFHNVYGPFGNVGRRQGKGASGDSAGKFLKPNGTAKRKIVIWGDGPSTRSFMYIDDCVKGIFDIMYSGIEEPINLGSSEMVSINALVDIVEGIAGIKLRRSYDLDAPKGVRGRNSDNELIRNTLNWEPSLPPFLWQSLRNVSSSLFSGGSEGSQFRYFRISSLSLFRPRRPWALQIIAPPQLDAGDAFHDIHQALMDTISLDPGDWLLDPAIHDSKIPLTQSSMYMKLRV